MDEKVKRNSLNEVIYFYEEQLRRFKKIGIGKKTEFNTVVTDRLIDCTKRRLKELKNKKLNIINAFYGEDNE